MERTTRKPLRLPGYDYSSYGYYFVTLCVKNKECLLGTVRDDAVDGATVLLPPLGEEVKKSWLKLEALNPNVKLDTFVIMPNHIYGIIILEHDDCMVSAQRPAGFGVRESSERRTLPGLMKDFKSVTTRVYQRKFGGQESLWQTSFYGEIIRNQVQYDGVWRYIADNPRKWQDDRYCG